MNAPDFISWLFHICNLPTLIVLIPFCSPYTPSIDYTHLSTNYDNTSVDCIDFSTDYANKYDDCVNVHNDWVNIVIDSADTHDKSSSKSYIPNPSLL